MSISLLELIVNNENLDNRENYIVKLKSEDFQDRKSYLKAYRKEWSKISHPKQIYLRYKISARHANIDFLISFKDFMTFWQKPCKYCGGEIQTIGLDKIEPIKGYIINNINSCCPIKNFY